MEATGRDHGIEPVKEGGFRPELRHLVAVPVHREQPSAPAHDVSGEDPAGGGKVTVGVRDSGRSSLLLFLSAGCSGCEVFWDAVRDPVAAGFGDDQVLTVVVREHSASDEGPALGRLASCARVPVVCSDAAWAAYRVQGPPFFVLVDGVANAVVTEGVAWATEQVVEHVRLARRLES